MKYLRSLKYLINSSHDQLDILLNVPLFVIGIYFIASNNSLDASYSFFQNFNITEELGIFFFVSGILNVIRLVMPWRINPYIVVIIQSLTIFCWLLLTFSVSISPTIPTFTYGTFSLASIFSLLRTPK